MAKTHPLLYDFNAGHLIVDTRTPDAHGEIVMTLPRLEVILKDYKVELLILPPIPDISERECYENDHYPTSRLLDDENIEFAQVIPHQHQLPFGSPGGALQRHHRTNTAGPHCQRFRAPL